MECGAVRQMGDDCALPNRAGFSVINRENNKAAASISLAAAQTVEKPVVAIKPQQFFCIETKKKMEKAAKCTAILLAISSVFRHPAPDGGLSISMWPVFSDSSQQT